MDHWDQWGRRQAEIALCRNEVRGRHALGYAKNVLQSSLDEAHFILAHQEEFADIDYVARRYAEELKTRVVKYQGGTFTQLTVWKDVRSIKEFVPLLRLLGRLGWRQYKKPLLPSTHNQFNFHLKKNGLKVKVQGHLLLGEEEGMCKRVLVSRETKKETKTVEKWEIVCPGDELELNGELSE